MILRATISAIELDCVLISAKDGREWLVDRRDVPPELSRDGQPVYLRHDADGFVTEIVERVPDPLPAALRARINAVRKWVDTV
ncbi:hypothetical protein G6L37_00595 [Agrobacterium rubi]|nr:hypothetical protein [Agrobacterium rubi]NTF23888.1 hypothetical protein [Agrobacterium rubi]